MRARRVVDYLVYVAVRLFVCVVQSLPIAVCELLARGFATLATKVFRIRHDVLDDNLRHAFPELSAAERRRITWRMWEHLLLMVAEVAHAPRKIHHTNWRRYIRLNDPDVVVRLMYDTRPTILVSAHFGNFEMGGFTLGLFGFKTHSVARTLDNPYLDRFINQFRAAGGQYIIPKNGSADHIAGLLASGGTLALLADQDAGPKGCWVDFFGRPASTHKAIALFSLGNDAPLVVMLNRRSGRTLHAEMGVWAIADPRDSAASLGGVRELTQWYTSHLERMIRTEPHQYWWVHRRWKRRPGKKKQKTRVAECEVQS